jgi:hypothetical protein
MPDNVILETGTLPYHFTTCISRQRKDQMEKPRVSLRHFRLLFRFQLGGSSAREMIGRTAKEADNLVDFFHGGGGPESGPLSSRPHVLMATLSKVGEDGGGSGAAFVVG